jgi:hypothetical protein
MSNDSYSHADCGGSLSLWADLIYCTNCGHIPVDLASDMASTDITEFLPCLIEAGIIAATDLHGISLKQI